ncbi:hypothetical protein EV363DRAFT_1417714 [Boletus edulis]|nr:hypothetical protein EV363DRAFT_1417714 [Boletus edulis]
MAHGYSKGTALSVVVFWQYVVFLTATDLVMIVRVYAMWSQSKRILSILLFVHYLQSQHLLISCNQPSLRLALGIMLLVLAVTQTLNQNTVVNITGMITPNTALLLFISSFCSVILIPLMPRFIMGVRELYDSKLRGQGIDTGFGVLSQPISSETVTVSTIVFPDVTPGQVVEGETDESEAIRLEGLGDSIHQV